MAELNNPNDEGILSEREFAFNDKYSNLARFPIDDGTDPVKQLDCKLNVIKFANFPISLGILPKRQFWVSWIVLRPLSSPSVAGNVPLCTLPFKTKDVIMVSLLYPTPVHELIGDVGLLPLHFQPATVDFTTREFAKSHIALVSDADTCNAVHDITANQIRVKGPKALMVNYLRFILTF